MIAHALVDEPASTRYAFYLAQSYRDHGDDARAAVLYLARAGMGPGDHAEEVYCAYLEAGRAFLRLNQMDNAKAALIRAHQAFPARREAMAELARVFALKAATSPPAGTLFVEPMEHDA
jgi:cytochrome c-type biogenesis protein CcmH/NrfG